MTKMGNAARAALCVVALATPGFLPAQETWNRISDDYFNRGVVSPDGSLVACGAYTVKLFRASDGAFLRTLFPRDSQVEKIQFDSSGQRILVGNHYGWQVLRVSDGVVLLDVPANYASSSALSPDGSILVANDNATGGKAYSVADGTVRYTFTYNIGVPANRAPVYTSGRSLYEFGTGSLMRRLTESGFSYSWHYRGAMSKDDSKYAMPVSNGQYPSALALWDLSQNASPAIIQGAFNENATLCFLRGDSKLAAEVLGGENIYDLATLQLERTLANTYVESATGDGLNFLASSGGNNLRLWDAASWTPGTIRYGYDPFASGDSYAAVTALSDDGSLLAVARRPNGATIWTVYDVHTQQTLFSGNDDCRAMAFSHDGTKLAILTRPSAQIVNARTGAVLFTLPAPPGGYGFSEYGGAFCGEFSADDMTFALGGGWVHSDKSGSRYYNCQVRLFSLGDGSLQQTLTGFSRYVTDLHFADDKVSIFAVGGNTGRFALADGTILKTYDTNPYSGCVFSRTNAVLAGLRGDSIVLLHLYTGKQITVPIEDGYELVLAFTRHNLLEMKPYVRYFNQEASINVRRLSDGKVVGTYANECGTGVLAVAFSKNGQQMAYTRRDPALFVLPTPQLFR